MFQEMPYTFMTFLGLLTALYFTCKLSVFGVTLLRNYLSNPLDVQSLGAWALVTGATDGIGKAFAIALARKGLNIVLVSRSMHKLQKVAAEIEAEHSVKTRVIEVDFAVDASIYRDRIGQDLGGLEIGVLVNNVGMAYKFPEEFLAMDKVEYFTQKVINVNISALNTMTNLVLPQMVERRKGAVINVSSIGAVLYCPLLAVYASSKLYVDKFSTCLEAEYRDYGITVQCLLPCFVVSNLSGLKKASLRVPTPDVFVASALGRLGIWSRTTGYWVHDFQMLYAWLLPEWLSKRIMLKKLRTAREKLRAKQ